MTTEDVNLLFEYDRWANKRVLEAASALRQQDFTHDLGGGFCCVRNVLAHLVGGEWVWLAYCQAPSHGPALAEDLRSQRDALFDPSAFPNVAAVQTKWAEVEKDQIEFLNRLTNELLEKMLPFRETRIRLAHILQHVANHSTYHRGQVALMMRQLGVEPAATDFHVFLVEGLREPTS